MDIKDLTKNKPNPALEQIKKKAQEIKFGDWEIRLIIHSERVVGFDELKPPVVKFRE